MRSQRWLLDPLLALYENKFVNKAGNCWGYSNSLICLLLENKRDYIKMQNQIIKNTPITKLFQAIDEVKIEHLLLVASEKINILDYLEEQASQSNTDWDEAYTMDLLEGVLLLSELEKKYPFKTNIQADQEHYLAMVRKRVSDKEKTWSLEKQVMLHLLGFFESIIFFQNQDLFKEMLGLENTQEQLIDKHIMSLVMSNELKAVAERYMQMHPHQFKTISECFRLPYRFSNSYNESELTTVLLILRKKIDNYIMKKKVDHTDYQHHRPLVMRASSGKHAIVIAYDPNDKTWFFGNANGGYADEFKNENKLAGLIISAFSKNEIAVFSIKFFSSPFDAEAAHIYLHDFAKNAAIRELFRVNTATMNRTDSKGISLLHIAVGFHQTDLARALLDRGVDVNAQCHEGMTPLMLGIIKKSPCVNLLLSHPTNQARLNIYNNKGKTALYYAKLHSTDTWAQLLIQHGAIESTPVSSANDRFFQKKPTFTSPSSADAAPETIESAKCRG